MFVGIYKLTNTQYFLPYEEEFSYLSAFSLQAFPHSGDMLVPSGT